MADEGSRIHFCLHLFVYGFLENHSGFLTDFNSFPCLFCMYSNLTSVITRGLSQNFRYLQLH